MKQFVAILIAFSVIVSFCASVYFAIQYFKYENIARTERGLSEFIDSKTEIQQVQNPLTGYTNQVTVNVYNDSINKVFEPFVQLLSGYDTGYDAKANLHGLGEMFSLGQMAFLNQQRVPKSFPWTSNLNSLEVPNGFDAHIGQSGEVYGVYASSVQARSIKGLIGTTSDFVLGVLLFLFVLKSVKHEFYPKDFIFIRYDFVNKSHIIGRRLLSVFLNVFLFMGCIATIIFPFIFYNDVLFSSYDNDLVPLGLTYFMAFLVLFYIITNGIWWILDKNDSK